MPTLETAILQLADAEAGRILDTFARHQPDYRQQSPTPELREALRADPELSPAAASEGELARAALLLLAGDPDRRPVLAALVQGPALQRFGVVESAAVVGGVLFVLGSHVLVERDPQGRWRCRFEKKPTDPKLLKTLMEKLLGYLDKESG
ncbi:MAG: hypothetical protein M3Z21_08990 [Pseudomonadota bacterium]|nr:hypothetical protein [Pseudomonadota bacterium]